MRQIDLFSINKANCFFVLIVCSSILLLCVMIGLLDYKRSFGWPKSLEVWKKLLNGCLDLLESLGNNNGNWNDNVTNQKYDWLNEEK